MLSWLISYGSIYNYCKLIAKWYTIRLMFKPVSLTIDFPKMERELLQKWYKTGIVEKYLHRNDSSEKRFSFLDGPITANNPMGVHHAWGRTYKDLWQRFWNMRGYKERFQNGFDCQGLWVEVEVEKELGIKNKRDIENLVEGDPKASIAKFVELCKERVLKFSKIQTEQSKRLGYFMDWDHSYYTMSDENNYMIWYFLKVCHEKGWIYKGEDSVPWCPRCQTAISQHEMLTEDYKELTHETVFVKLPIVTPRWENTSLVVWTTTPWTVPANVAVAINRKFTYRICKNSKTKEKIIIIDKDENGVAPVRMQKGKEVLVQDYIFNGLAKEDESYEHTAEVKDISGKELVGLKYIAPFDHLPIVENARRENPNKCDGVVGGSEIVTAGEGTGLLHVAPGAGKEDFDLGKKEGLPVISPINDEAFYVDGMDECSKQNAKKHPEIIIDYLKSFENGRFLLKVMGYTHRYPASWRCKTELVWKVTEEWYIAMDVPENKKRKTLRMQMVDTAKMIDWHPSFGLERELDWLSNMHDWLISKKNRYWGLALPIYECQKCGSFEIVGSKEELKEKAVEGWDIFEGHTPHKPFIDEVKIKCSKCGEIVSRTNDVGNVWLDAGIVPFSTLVDPVSGKVSYMTDKVYWKKWFPANFITESFPGQFKNWFYSLIAMSTVLEDSNSFKTILGFATMVDEKGEPFHKSKGNAIEFVEGADTFGADIIRWICSQHDITSNIQFGPHLADQTRRKLLTLWNVYNFFVLNASLDNWTPSSRHSGDERSEDSRIKKETDSGQTRLAEASAKRARMTILDEWILARLNQTITVTTESLEEFDAYGACNAIEGMINDTSLWYVRRSRNRVGVGAKNIEDKNATYHTLYKVLVVMSQLAAPIMPFISDEMYTNLTGEESVHLSNWPTKIQDSRFKIQDEKLIEEMQLVRKIVEIGLSKRKELGIKVRQPLNKFSIYNLQFSISNEVSQLIKDELNVKNIDFVKGEGELSGELDTVITPELKAEGEARDIIRMIQEERKKLGTSLLEKVAVVLPSWPKEFEDYIKKHALVSIISKGSTFEVRRV